MTLFIGNVNRNAWNQGPKAAIMPVCNLAILDLVNLVVKWWKFGVIVASHSFMSNVDPGLQPVKLKNWSCLAAKINVQNLYHVGIGMNLENIINWVLNGWPIKGQYFEIWSHWSWQIGHVLLQRSMPKTYYMYEILFDPLIWDDFYKSDIIKLMW